MQKLSITVLLLCACFVAPLKSYADNPSVSADLQKFKEDKLREQRKAREEQAEKLYQDAINLYDQKKFPQSQEAFSNVQKLIYDYKDTQKYLKRIADDSKERQKQEERQKQKELEEQRLKEQEAKKKELSEKAKAEKAKQEELRQQQKQKEQEAEKAYKDAMSLYQQKKLAEAKSAFENLEKVQPNYKSTHNYLKRIDDDVARDQKREELRKQKEAEEQRRKELEQKRLEEKSHSQESKPAQVESPKSAPAPVVEAPKPAEPIQIPLVKEEPPQEKTEDRYVDRQDAALAKVQEEQAQQTLHNEEEAEKAYQDAILFFYQKDYARAKSNFENIDRSIPNYKSTQDYLKRINNYLDEDQKRADRKKLKEEKEFKRKQAERLRYIENEKRHGNQGEISQSSGITSPQAGVNLAPITIPSPQDMQEEAKLIANMAQRSSKLYNEILDIADDKSTNLAKNKLNNLQKLLNGLNQKKQQSLAQLRAEEEAQRQKERREKAQESYDAALLLLRNQNFDAAKQKFTDVESTLPDFKSTRSFISHIDGDRTRAQQDAMSEKTFQEEKAAQEEERRKKVEEDKASRVRLAQGQERLSEISERTAALNDEIIKLAKAGEYAQAKAKFDELETLVNELKTTKETVNHEQDKQDLGKAKAKQHEELLKQREKILREKHTQLSKEQEANKINKIQVAADAKEMDLLKQKENRLQKEAIFKQGLDLYRAKKYTAARVIFADLVAQGEARAIGYLKRTDELIHRNVTEAYQLEDRQRSDYLNERRKQDKLKSKILAQEKQQQLHLNQELERQKRRFENEHQQEQRRLQLLKMEEREWKRLETKRQRMEARLQKEKDEYRFRKIQPVSKTPAAPKDEKSSSVESEQGFVKVRSAKQTEEEKKRIQEEEKKKLQEEQDKKAQEQKQLEEQKRLDEQNRLDEQRRKGQQDRIDQEHQQELQRRRDEADRRKEEVDRRKEEAKKRQEQIDARQKQLKDDEDRKEERRKKIEDERKAREEARREKEEARKKQIEDAKRAKEEERLRRIDALKEREEERRKQILDRQKEFEQEQNNRQKKFQEEQQRKEEDRKQFENERKQREEARQKEMERRRIEAEQQERDRLEKKRAEDQARMEQKQKEEIERTARERQQKLESERKEIQKQLNSGVDAVYQDAVKLYKQGYYKAAAAQFADVEDLMPNYKNTQSLLHDSQSKMNNEQPHPAAAPAKVETPQKSGNPSDDIARTLDLFENAK